MGSLKNIIVVNDYDYINGGTSQIAIGTSNGLVSKGFNVCFFSAVSADQYDNLSPAIRRINTGQYDILNHPSRPGAMAQGIWNRKSARKLKELLSGFSPADTVIHLHGWSKALSASIGNVLASSGFPIICTLHDYFIACPNGGFYNYQTQQICKLTPMSAKCICTNCDARSYPQKMWRVVRQLVQEGPGKMPSGIKNYITVSKFSTGILKKYLPDHSRVFVIGNPVAGTIKPDRAVIASNRAICVGRLSTEKGIAIACEAARTAKVPLTVIGDGPLNDQLRQHYPEVDFKGWLQPSQVFAEIQRSSVLIFPSLLYETQGLAVLEALSYGLPAIVSDQCAASEFIDGQNGITFQIGNPDDLAEKLTQYFSNLAAAEAMSRYAYDNYWNDPYTMEKYFEELLVAYRDILLNT